MNIGKKDDQSKPPVTQFLRQFPRAIRYLARVSEYGHSRYGSGEDEENWDNWKKVENGKFRYEQALGRHLLEKSDDIDVDSGFLAISHTAWNAIAVLEKLLETEEHDIKRKGGQNPPDEQG